MEIVVTDSVQSVHHGESKPFSLRAGLQQSLHLLERRDRYTLVVVTLAQVLSAFLDLLGVVLIALVTTTILGNIGSSTTSDDNSIFSKLLSFTESWSVERLMWVSAIAGAVLIIKSLINVTLTRFTLGFLARRQADISGRLTTSLLSSSIAIVQARPSQERAYALTAGVNFATLIVLGQAQIAITESAVLLLLTSALFIVNPFVTTFALIFFALVAFVMHRILSVRADRLGQTATGMEITSVLTIQEALSSYREIFVSNRRGNYSKRISDLRRRAAHVQADLSFVGLVPKFVLEISLVAGAGLLVLSQVWSSGLVAGITIVAIFLVAASRILPSILRFQTALIVMRSGAGQAGPTYSLASELADHNKSESAYVADADQRNGAVFCSDILLRNVSFSYPNSDTEAIRKINLKIESGSSTAIVGASGSGKSTLADLILGVLDPERGDVLISGSSPHAAVRHWPGSIGYVPQNVAVVNGTVRSNVGLGLPESEIDDSAVRAALERAHLMDFLLHSREGIHTLVGEHGVRLSGGQLQRLGLARALYSNPSLLVLDEATSALDAETEQAITDTLSEIAEHTTLVVIAHRLATIRSFDRIVYLENGFAVALGTFDQVRSQSKNFDRQAALLGL